MNSSREEVITLREQLPTAINGMLFRAYVHPERRDEIVDQIRRELAAPVTTSEHGALPGVEYKPPRPRCSECNANIMLSWCFRDECPMRECNTSGDRAKDENRTI